MSGFPSPSDGRPRGRLTALGLGLVVIGWAILVADLALGEAVLKVGSLVAVLSIKADIVVLAQTLVLTGFGMALLGALRDGFGALNRFFDAVLQRAATPRPAPMPEPSEPEDAVVVPSPSTDLRAAAAPPPKRERNYVVRPDGSVEVETLLGTRVFATLDEARDFIR